MGEYWTQKRGPGPWFNIKMSSYRYRKSHCGDKTILRPSYLHNGISYTGKTTSLYWIGAQDEPCTNSYNPWWCHQMQTISALLALCAGNSLVTGEFPSQRPVTRSFDVFFNLCLNKRLSKQSRRWRFETPSHPLCRHCIGRYQIISYKIMLSCALWYPLKICCLIITNAS